MSQMAGNGYVDVWRVSVAELHPESMGDEERGKGYE